MSCRAGKSDVVVVGNRGLARPPQSGKAWWWPGFSTNGIAAFHLWTNESAGRGRAGRVSWEKRLVEEVSDDNGKCSAGQSGLWSEYGSSWWWIVSKNDSCKCEHDFDKMCLRSGSWSMLRNKDDEYGIYLYPIHEEMRRHERLVLRGWWCELGVVDVRNTTIKHLTARW